jgi:hypothetical protein
LFSGQSASTKYARRAIFAALEITEARFDVVIPSSTLFPATAARGAATTASAAFMAAASAAMMIESVAATVATGAEATTVAEVTLVSDAAATLAATQSAANGGPVGDDESAAIAMQ